MVKDLENIFLTTIESNKNRIYRICSSYSSGIEDAKDLYQEVLLNLWKSLPSFNNQSDINTWAFNKATGVKCYFDKIIVNGQLKNDYSPVKNEIINNERK